MAVWAEAGTVPARWSRLATAHGLFNLLTGLWPLVHYRSFEAVTGPKTDEWLVRCVGGLGAAAGYVQLRAGRAAEGLASARRLGAGAAATFGAIDLVYGGSGRISRIYLLDAVVELAWLAAWAAPARRTGGKRRNR
ncbi:hypothetical protein HER39_07350 [Arthrobacter deserti]|uniref:DUF4345 domain-containing protein n=1 Tax=Arthrobacter deserti TaxID=1742687 RepID=A0ABX1JM61_9MICC|nr:hypothetical protein [Arthrobacter deserti]